MWKNIDTCFYKLHKPISKYILAFDFDDTLVKRNTDVPLENVITFITNSIKNNYNIVIFSNQKGITKQKTTHTDVQNKMNNFEKKISKPVSFLYATSDGKYRKPNIGMYDLYKNIFKIDIKFIYYCGDAAGRNNDFSISDLYFANNIGIPFKTPEQIFKNKTPDIIANTKKKTLINSLYKYDNWINGVLYNKRDIVTIASNNDIQKIMSFNFDINQNYLILMVGPQGSGKSTLSKMISNKFHFPIVSNDTAKKLFNKTPNAYFSDLVKKGVKSIIIDNTSPTYESRQKWMNKVKNWNTIILFIDVNKDVSIHSINYRSFHSGQTLPMVCIHTYFKKLEKPTKKEGHIITFSGIIHNNSNYNHNLRFV